MKRSIARRTVQSGRGPTRRREKQPCRLGGYSPEVDNRPIPGNLADILIAQPRPDIPVPPPATGYVPTMNANGIGFQNAVEMLWNKFDAETRRKFPESWHFDSA